MVVSLTADSEAWSAAVRPSRTGTHSSPPHLTFQQSMVRTNVCFSPMIDRSSGPGVSAVVRKGSVAWCSGLSPLRTRASAGRDAGDGAEGHRWGFLTLECRSGSGPEAPSSLACWTTRRQFSPFPVRGFVLVPVSRDHRTCPGPAVTEHAVDDPPDRAPGVASVGGPVPAAEAHQRPGRSAGRRP